MKFIKDRVIIKVDVEQKNNHTFSNGITIRLERDYNNLDQKYTQQVLGEVLSSETVPVGSLILFHHNSIHDVNTVFDSDLLTKEEKVAGFKVISLDESECFLWKQIGECFTWKPIKNFCTALRVFEPYKGALVCIEPKIIKNVLYLTSGEYKGNVVHTVKASDYQITFRNEKGIDERIIRCRHFEDRLDEREEIIMIDGYLTDKVNNGKLLVGIEKSDCKTLN